MCPRRLVVRAALALTLALPASSRAGDEDELRARAAALEEAGYAAEAAVLSERAIDEAEGGRQRAVAYFQAIDAWLVAFEVSGDAGHRCAARRIFMRALDDAELDPAAHAELREHLGDRVGTASECEGGEAMRVPLLDTDGQLPPLQDSRQPPGIDDHPKRSPRTLAGAALLGVATPALGGFVYAVIADRAIVRGFARLGAEVDATGTYDRAEAEQMRAQAPVVRGMAIGFGTAAAVLTSAAIGLLVSGRRQHRAAAISLAPHARAGLGGVVLTGRF